MKYIITSFKNGLPDRIAFPEEEMGYINSFINDIRTAQQYQEIISAINEVQSGEREKKFITDTCKLIIQKDISEIEYTLDFDPDDWEPGENASRFSNIPTAKFKEAIEIWWKEYNTFLTSRKV